MDPNGDFDSDGLSELQEYTFNTNPHLADTDGDGLSDLEEIETGTNPLSEDGDAIDSDTDGDTLPLWKELELGTNPFYSDTDQDGLLDREEWEVIGTSPTMSDTDGDGFDDGIESLFGTNPLVAEADDTDTDRDGVSNADEVAGGSDRGDFYSRPGEILTPIITTDDELAFWGFAGSEHEGVLDLDLEFSSGAEEEFAPVLVRVRTGESLLRLEDSTDYRSEVVVFADSLGRLVKDAAESTRGVEMRFPDAHDSFVELEVRPLSEALASNSPDLVLTLQTFPEETAYWSFNEGTGSTIRSTPDIAGEGVLLGDPKWVDLGDERTHLRFEGKFLEGVRLFSYGGDEFDSADGFTLAFWTRFIAENPALLVGSTNLDVNGGVAISALDDGRLEVQLGGTGGIVFRSTVGVGDGEWYHIALSYDPVSESIELRADGVPMLLELVSGADGTLSADQLSLVFGNSAVAVASLQTKDLIVGGYSNEQPFNGSLDAVRWYDQVLTDIHHERLSDRRYNRQVQFYNYGAVLESEVIGMHVNGTATLNPVVEAFDVDQGPADLTYFWQIDGEQPGSVAISGEDTATPTIVVDAPGTYSIMVTASDGLHDRIDRFDFFVEGEILQPVVEFVSPEEGAVRRVGEPFLLWVNVGGDPLSGLDRVSFYRGDTLLEVYEGDSPAFIYHTETVPGTYTYRADALGNLGRTASDSTTISVVDPSVGNGSSDDGQTNGDNSNVNNPQPGLGKIAEIRVDENAVPTSDSNAIQSTFRNVGGDVFEVLPPSGVDVRGKTFVLEVLMGIHFEPDPNVDPSFVGPPPPVVNPPSLGLVSWTIEPTWRGNLPGAAANEPSTGRPAWGTTISEAGEADKLGRVVSRAFVTFPEQEGAVLKVSYTASGYDPTYATPFIVSTLLPVEILTPKEGSDSSGYVPDDLISTDKLKVAKWENAFEGTTDNPSVKQDFNEGDVDRFYLKVPMPWNEGQGNATVKIKTDSDPENEIEVIEIPGEPGVFRTNGLILVSSDADDDPDDKYPQDGTDEGLDDVTHKVKLGDSVTFVVTPPGSDPIEISADCPATHTVDVQPYRLPGTTPGSYAFSLGFVEKEFEIANEVFAQIGLKINPASEKRVADRHLKNRSVDVDDGLQLKRFNPLQNAFEIADEGDSFLRNWGSDSNDDIRMFYLTFWTNEGSTSPSSQGTATFKSPPFNNNAFISEELKPNSNHLYFVSPHELGHILSQEGHIEDDPFNPTLLDMINLMNGQHVSESDSATATKRLTQAQQEKMLSHEAVEEIEEANE